MYGVVSCVMYIQVPLNIENVKIQDFTVQYTYQEALVKYYS